MPSDATHKHRTKLALLIVVAAAAATGGGFAAARTDVAARAPGGVLTYETDEFRYEYQSVTGREALYAKCEGTRRFVDVAAGNAATVAACRRALEAELGVPDLSVLSRDDPDRDAIARLHAIGYL